MTAKAFLSIVHRILADRVPVPGVAVNASEVTLLVAPALNKPQRLKPDIQRIVLVARGRGQPVTLRAYCHLILRGHPQGISGRTATAGVSDGARVAPDTTNTRRHLPQIL